MRCALIIVAMFATSCSGIIPPTAPTSLNLDVSVTLPPTVRLLAYVATVASSITVPAQMNTYNLGEYKRFVLPGAVQITGRRVRLDATTGTVWIEGVVLGCVVSPLQPPYQQSTLVIVTPDAMGGGGGQFETWRVYVEGGV